MSRGARAHWDLVVPELVRTGVAKAPDAPALAAMCEQWAEYENARAIEIEAHDIRGMRLRQMLMNGALRSWRDLAARFGMTPADRAKIEVDKSGQTTNNFESYLGPPATSPAIAGAIKPEGEGAKVHRRRAKGAAGRRKT